MQTKPSDLPEYPEIPAGFSHWEYKGIGYEADAPCVCCVFYEIDDSWRVIFDQTPCGCLTCHYAVAVPFDKPAEPPTPCLQMQLEHAKKELAVAHAQLVALRAGRALVDTDLPPIARTEANLWKAKFFELSKELTKANKGIRRLLSSRDRMRERLTLLQDRIELAEQALGNHPDSNTDLAAEILRLRDENRDWFHKHTKRMNGLPPVALSVIGKDHFGNPIPPQWYSAAKELLKCVGVKSPDNDAPPNAPQG